MIDDRDPLLTQLFAEQSRPADGSDFMAQFINRLEHDRRKRRIYRLCMIIAGVMVAALLAPWIAQLAASALGLVAAGIVAGSALLNFPMAWLALCSLVGSLLPVLYLGITRRW